MLAAFILSAATKISRRAGDAAVSWANWQRGYQTDPKAGHTVESFSVLSKPGLRPPRSLLAATCRRFGRSFHYYSCCINQSVLSRAVRSALDNAASRDQGPQHLFATIQTFLYSPHLRLVRQCP